LPCARVWDESFAGDRRSGAVQKPCIPFLDERYALDREQFKPVLDEFYTQHGWDIERGWPTRECLRELGLEGVDPLINQKSPRWPITNSPDGRCTGLQFALC